MRLWTDSGLCGIEEIGSGLRACTYYSIYIVWTLSAYQAEYRLSHDSVPNTTHTVAINSWQNAPISNKLSTPMLETNLLDVIDWAYVYIVRMSEQLLGYLTPKKRRTLARVIRAIAPRLHAIAQLGDCHCTSRSRQHCPFKRRACLFLSCSVPILWVTKP